MFHTPVCIYIKFTFILIIMIHNINSLLEILTNMKIGLMTIIYDKYLITAKKVINIKHIYIKIFVSSGNHR